MKKLKLAELTLKSFVTDRDRAHRLEGGGFDAFDNTGEHNCTSPRCQSNPQCSFSPCEA